MISIDKVYSRVLDIANKEQRGYIAPDQFNSYAEQAQLEIFDGYLKEALIASQGPNSSEEYMNLKMSIGERMMYFDNTTTVSKSGTLYEWPDDFYTMGHVTINGRMAEEISHNELVYVNLSQYTKPTTTQPVLTRHEGGFKIYPESYEDDVTLVYLRKPTTPEWAFMVDTEGEDEPIYDSANSTDFDLHPGEEIRLVYAILVLAGVEIKQPDLVQFGLQAEQKVD